MNKYILLVDERRYWLGFSLIELLSKWIFGLYFIQKLLAYCLNINSTFWFLYKVNQKKKLLFQCEEFD